ncbi:MAG: triphosphoribosyl-dephospho-CoA synthase [Nitrososphaerales archaeon]
MDLEDISLAAELACLLEVSATPKPGNVHRFASFEDLTYENFLSSSVALGKAIRRICENSIKGKVSFGESLLESVRILKHWCKAGNTHFGTLILFIPLSLTSSKLLYTDKISEKKLADEVKKFVQETDSQDSINFFLAASEANVGALGRLKKKEFPDLNSTNWKDKILEENITLFKIMSYSSNYDLVAREFSKGFEISFKSYHILLSYYRKFKDINLAIVHTFLEIMSKYPDTLIARKIALRKSVYLEVYFQEGLEISKKYSERAKKILELGGLNSKKGIEALVKMDEELRKNKLNPGSIADITACSIFLALLFGLRI